MKINFAIQEPELIKLTTKNNFQYIFFLLSHQLLFTYFVPSTIKSSQLLHEVGIIVLT